MRIICLLSLAAMTSGCSPTPESDMKSIELDVSELAVVEVGVMTPSHRFIWTHATSFSCTGTSVADGRLTIDPSTAVGYYWDAAGRKHEVTVFSETGVHKVLVSDNLETEAENSALVTISHDVREAVKESSASGGCRAND